ncbi:MarR family transcriptional regulator [Caenimonas sedimenti]|uniref:MarR family transcriptional regulator n=1 Tax=Caenimonas sedimenti TaxID=2596921 RepID=A0A562ZV26_9BURK|nr:MarR family transcriptional regulator [Caenimonas sedimenti]TWO72237.1 MarR family transcriptional regulator [Caenimonas sedimenti]
MPSRLAHPQALDDLLLYRMNRALQVAGGMVIRLCEGRFGITRREWRVIGALVQEPGLLSSQLAERAQLDRARTSRAITSLVAKKLVRRATGTGDRRQASVALTDAGHALYGELFPLVREINQSLLTALPDADVALLDTALAALQQRAETLMAQAELPKADRHRGGRGRTATG